MVVWTCLPNEERKRFSMNGKGLRPTAEVIEIQTEATPMIDCKIGFITAVQKLKYLRLAQINRIVYI